MSVGLLPFPACVKGATRNASEFSGASSPTPCSQPPLRTSTLGGQPSTTTPRPTILPPRPPTTSTTPSSTLPVSPASGPVASSRVDNGLLSSMHRHHVDLMTTGCRLVWGCATSQSLAHHLIAPAIHVQRIHIASTDTSKSRLSGTNATSARRPVFKCTHRPAIPQLSPAHALLVLVPVLDLRFLLDHPFPRQLHLKFDQPALRLARAQHGVRPHLRLLLWLWAQLL